MDNNKDKIAKMIEETISNINSKVPDTITDNQKKIMLDHYSNSNKLEEDIQKELNNYSEELLNKLGYKDPINGKYDLNQIQKTIAIIRDINKFGNTPIYLDSEVTPFLLGVQIDNRPRNRQFPGLAFLIDLKDIDRFRNNYKKTPYYNEEDDSLNNIRDGNDYGLQLNVDGVLVDIYPFIKDKDSITKYMIRDNKCIVEDIKDNSNYLKTYEVNGEKINSVSLEYLKRRADDNKDNDISKMIEDYGYSYDIYNSITPSKIVKEADLNTVNNVPSSEIVKNSLVRFLYNVKMNDNKDVSQEKIDETIKRLHNKDYDDINKFLERAKDNLNQKIEIPKILYDQSLKEEKDDLKSKGFSTTENMAYTIIIAGIIIILLSIIIRLV